MVINLQHISLDNGSIILLSDENKFKLKEIILSIPRPNKKTASSIQFLPSASESFITRIIAEQSAIILNRSILLIANISNPTESVAREAIKKIKELSQSA